MRRPFLVGALIGVVIALFSVAITNVWLRSDSEPLYLRIADDSFDPILGPKHKVEEGPASVRLIRHCGIDEFTTIRSLPDYAGSSLVPLDSTSEGEINCLIGEARIHGLSLAIAPGPDAANFECLPGWPSRFRPFNASDYELCRSNKPNAIFPATNVKN